MNTEGLHRLLRQLEREVVNVSRGGSGQGLEDHFIVQ